MLILINCDTIAFLQNSPEGSLARKVYEAFESQADKESLIYGYGTEDVFQSVEKMIDERKLAIISMTGKMELQIYFVNADGNLVNLVVLLRLMTKV